MYNTNYGAIKKHDIVNGESVRVSLFVSGRSYRCANCFNQEVWDFVLGRPFIGEVQQEILTALSPEYINGLALLDGESFEPENQHALAGLLRQVKKKYSQKDIWCYTGYLLDRELLQESRARCEIMDEMLGMTDVLVGERFVEELKDISLASKGSSNQRIIDVRQSLYSGRVVIKMQQPLK